MGARKRRGRGEGSIEELPDGRWRAILSLGVDPVTKKRRRKLYGKSKGEVLAKLREAQANRANGRTTDPGRLTVGEWAERCLEVRRAAVESSTYARHKWTVEKHLKPHLGPVLLRDVEATHVEGFYASLAAAGVSQNERWRAGGVLSMLLRHAVRRRLIPCNPCSDVPRPKRRVQEFVPLTFAQMRALLGAAAGHRLAALWWLALDSGMRPGELLGLEWPHLDLSAGTVAVRQALEDNGTRRRIKEVKTPKGRRTIVLSVPTVKALKLHRERMLAEVRNVEAGPVFPSRSGTWIARSNLDRYVFKPLLARALCPPVRLYDLRHTSATLLLTGEPDVSEPVNIKVISERLGHASVEITLHHYCHVMPGQQGLAAGAVGKLFQGVPQTGPAGGEKGGRVDGPGSSPT